MKANPLILNNKLLLGRNEWCKLADIGIPLIKAKIDTGAKTSALHAFDITTKTIQGVAHVCFSVHPLQANSDVLVECLAPIVDERSIMSSNGHKEHRYVILTTLELGSRHWQVEMTLSNRDPLKYRLLLGRESLVGKVLIDPSLFCNQGKFKKKAINSLY